ncbi:MAG: 3'-5' exonuclease domain-containing protein 2 [bacterium]|nr:3'-5' exonuclease domain-containing protein 2 [bacterium]
MKRLTKEEIAQRPMRGYEGPVHVISSGDGLAEAVARLREEAILGFDTETRPAYKKGESYPPALLQLAGERAVYVFQLTHLRLPGPVRGILAAPDIVKAGVALEYDLRELRKIAPFEPAGFVELGDLARRAGLNNHGLRGLAAAVLGFRISKSSRHSNWASGTLTPAQIRYAATDAWVGRELYRKLRQMPSR